MRTRFSFLTLALLAILTMAVAIGCSDDEETTTQQQPNQTSVASPTAKVAKPGDAGIASNPRKLADLENILQPLDDGLAMWKTRPANEDRTGVTRDTIKIGRLSSVSNPGVAAVDSVFQGAINSIFKRVNDAGGIHGRKLELVQQDDGANPAVGVAAMKRLIEEDKVFAVLYPGPGCPACAEANTPYLAEKGVVQFAGNCNLKYLEPVTKSTCFFHGKPPEVVSISIIDAVKKTYPNAKKVAFIYETGNYQADSFKWRAQQVGLEVVSAVSYERTQPDLSSQVQQAVAAKPDVIAFGAISGAQDPSLFKTLRQNLGSAIPVIRFASSLLPSGELSKLMDGTVQLTFYADAAFWGTDAPQQTVWSQIATKDGWKAGPSIDSMAVHVEPLLRALELAGPDPTRQGLLEALETGFDGNWKCSYCIAPITLGSQDHYPNEGTYMARWSDAKQKYEHALGTADASVVTTETSKGQGLRGNYPGYECQSPSTALPKGTCPWKN